MRDAILCILRGYEKVRLNRNAQLNFDIGFFPIKKEPIKPTFMLIAIENAIAAKLATIQNYYLVQLIQTTNTNPKFLQQIFCLFTFLSILTR